ncbi:MAG: exosortase family protein XrtG [Clostridiales bacterium]|nr:exosortase family protein XrtG [Clostridiales bacterium]
MNTILIISFVLWIYALTVLKRGKLDFWYFIVGSVGLFIYALIVVEPVVLAPLQKAVSAVAGMFGDMTGIYESYFNKNIIFISTGDTNLSMYIDYECSGIIEILAFLALLWFFPLYHTYEKIVLSVSGTAIIFASNVLRIFVICLIIYVFGGSAYFIAHTIIGRLVFYACTVALYFFVFTKSQIIRQKVGGFKFDVHNADVS